MRNLIERGLLFGLYQASIAIGILLLPIALVMRKSGLTIPVHRLVEGLGRAYKSAR